MRWLVNGDRNRMSARTLLSQSEKLVAGWGPKHQCDTCDWYNIYSTYYACGQDMARQGKRGAINKRTKTMALLSTTFEPCWSCKNWHGSFARISQHAQLDSPCPACFSQGTVFWRCASIMFNHFEPYNHRHCWGVTWSYYQIMPSKSRMLFVSNTLL